MTTKEKEVQLRFPEGDFYTLSSECDCWDEDDNGDIVQPSECRGGCWADQVEFLDSVLQQIPHTTGWWHVEGLPLWSGTQSFLFEARNGAEFLHAITPNSEFHLRYAVSGTALIGIISHHDVPTGGLFKCSPSVRS